MPAVKSVIKHFLTQSFAAGGLQPASDEVPCPVLQSGFNRLVSCRGVLCGKTHRSALQQLHLLRPSQVSVAAWIC
jgi:hypothetical protein